MKTTAQVSNTPVKQTRLNRCLRSCHKLLSRIQNAKSTILEEFRDSFKAHEHLLHLALNEAEAVAWQTEIPHLVFPALAMEKAQAAANWQSRQQSLQRADHSPLGTSGN